MSFIVIAPLLGSSNPLTCPNRLYPMPLVMVNAVNGTGVLFNPLTVRTVITMVSPTLACALLPTVTS